MNRNNPITKRPRNHLRCPKCGFAVISVSDERHCARCDTEMFIENGK